MTTLDDLKTLYYIKDSFGNYYQLNGDKELVAAREQVEAGIFTYLEVSERLGNGKKAQFYQAVPVEGSDKPAEPGTENGSPSACSKRTVKAAVPSGRRNEANDSEINDIAGSGSGKGLHFTDFSELAQVDWIELLNNLAFIHAMMPAYKDKLNKDQSDTELLLIDLMHLVELYEYDDEMSLDIIDKIREAREKRRVIKNELFRVERFQDAVGSNAIAIKTRDAIEKIKKKEAATGQGFHQTCLQTYTCVPGSCTGVLPKDVRIMKRIAASTVVTLLMSQKERNMRWQKLDMSGSEPYKMNVNQTGGSLSVSRPSSSGMQKIISPTSGMTWIRLTGRSSRP